jgi:MFS family permease
MVNMFAAVGSAFSPLRLPNFRLYISAQLISNIGTFLQQTAQAWVVWELTRSEAASGTVALVNGLPLLLLTPWAGAWVDRLDRRKLLTATQIGMMILAFTLALLVQAGSVQFWHVMVLAGLLGIITTFDFTAHQTFLGDLAGMGEVRKAVTMNGMVLQGSRMFGAAVAGWIIARSGAATAFWINGLSFIVVIISLSLIRVINQTRSDREHKSPLMQMGDALRFLRTQPRMQDMFAFAAVIMLCFWSIPLALLPAFAEKVLGGSSDTFSALQAASGAGALIALLFVVPITGAQKRGGVMLVGALIFTGIAIVVLGLSSWLPLSMLAMGLATMGSPVVFTMALGLTQVMAPAAMRGRLISLFTMISLGVQPFAALLIGTLGQVIGVQTAILINGSICILAAVGIAIARRGLWAWQVDASAAKQKQEEVVPVLTGVD